MNTHKRIGASERLLLSELLYAGRRLDAAAFALASHGSTELAVELTQDSYNCLDIVQEYLGEPRAHGGDEGECNG